MRHALKLGDEIHEVWLAPGPHGERLLVGETWHDLPSFPAGAVAAVDGDRVHVHLGGRVFTIELLDPVARFADSAGGSAASVARAPMPGSVIAVHVGPGDAVGLGDPLVVIESMKMETTIRAARDGIVAAVAVPVGTTFERDAVLVTLVDEGE